jgi:hypothetical protein
MIHTPIKHLNNGRAVITIMTPPGVKKDLAEIFNLASKAYENCAKGAVFCQIDEGMMKVVFLPHDQALLVNEAFRSGGGV